MTLAQELQRLVAAVRRWGIARAAAAGVGGATLGLAIVAWAIADARWLAWPRSVPFLGVGAALVSAFAAAWWGRRLVRAAGPVAAAAIVEREGGLRHGVLRGALEVERDSSLGALAAGRVRSQLADGPGWAPAWRAAGRRAALGTLAAGAVGVAGAALAARGAADGWAATLHPVRAATGTLLPRPRVSAPALAVRGTALAVAVDAPGRKSLAVRWRALGAAWRDTTLALAGGRGALALGRADADVALVASDGRAASDTTRIAVVERPYLGDVTVRAVFPAYLGREAEDLAPGDAMRVPRGTRLVLGALASVPIARAALVYDRDTVPLVPSADGTRLAGSLVADRSRAWSFVAEPRDAGPPAEMPRPLVLDVLPDSIPEVAIVNPARDTTTTIGARVPVTIAAQDDHGLGELRLLVFRRRAEGGEVPLSTDVLAARPGPAWAGTVRLDVAARGLEPGDALRLVAEAVDASPWRQVARSRELLLRIPSLDEQRQLAREAADTAAASAQRVAAQQRALERRTAEEARARAAQAARGEATMDFQQAEQARQLAAEQRRATDRAKDVADQAAALERRLQQAGGLDSALAQRLREVQAMLNEAMTPEMAERLRQLERAAQQLSSADAAEQMSQLRQEQQKLREQLERAAALLQRAALEGAMQTLKDEAAELAARQQAMADSLAANRRDTARTAQAKRMAERTERFQQDAAKLQQKLQQAKAQAGAQGAQEAKAQAQQASQEMQQAASQAGQQPGEAADDAKRAAQAMQRAAQALQQGRQAQIGEWKREIAQELDRAAQEMQQLAQQQQDLAAQAQQGGDPSGMRGDQSAVQQGVERAADRVGATGKSTSLVSQRTQRAMGEAKRQVQEAAKGAGTPQQRAEAMQRAADQLKQAAQSLARDRERVNRSESASGFSEFLEELQKAANQQGSAAQQAQQLLQLNAQQRAQQRAQRADALRALAQQQRQVARALNEAGADDATGRTDAMAREAQKLAERLEQGGPDRETLARQQQLFRRLLDAGRSFEQQEQDETGKRDAKTGGDQRADPRGGRAVGATMLAPGSAELRALSSDERRLVGDYFRRLNAVPPR
ncbi:MAG: hypothetical protein ACK51E_07395 [Gemmatimonadota bacterium]